MAVNWYCLVMFRVKSDLRKPEFILVGVDCVVDFVFTGGFNLFVSAHYASEYVESLCDRYELGYIRLIHEYELSNSQNKANET